MAMTFDQQLAELESTRVRTSANFWFKSSGGYKSGRRYKQSWDALDANRIQEGEPTAGFEPATRCLQNSCSAS